MGGYRLYLPNEMIEGQMYLQLTMDQEQIVYNFVGPEDASRMIWREARLAQEYMRLQHNIIVHIR